MMMAYETVFHVLVEEEGEELLGFSLAAFLVVVEAECHESELDINKTISLFRFLPKFEVSFRLLFLFSSQLLVSRLDLHSNWQV